MAQVSSASRNYTVGWICAVNTEYVVALSLLDEEYPSDSMSSPNDNNVYTFGRIGAHNVVMACLPSGIYGLVSAASVAKDMHNSFHNIRFALIVGIGGGAPSYEHDIRLGDVVVSQPGGGSNGVIHYNFGKAIQGKEFQRTGSLNAPPHFVLSAMSVLKSRHEISGHRITESINKMLEQKPRLRRKYGKPPPETDRLYNVNFVHEDKIKSCSSVDESSNLIHRKPRGEDDDDPAIHYGLIASADCLMKDAITRDRLAHQGVLCFEMEAAGLMGFECVAVRGICDYADTHKNDDWQGYAACTAAAYAKELLGVIPSKVVEQSAPMKNHQDRVVEDILPALETRVEGLVHNVNRLGTSAASQEASFEGTATALTEIREGVSMLTQASSEYKEKLDDLRDSRAGADDIKFVTEKVERIDFSQESLAKDLKYLTQLIEEQKKHSTTQEAVTQWESLQEDARDQTLALKDLTGVTKMTLERTQHILDDVMKITPGNKGAQKAKSGIGIAEKGVEILSGMKKHMKYQSTEGKLGENSQGLGTSKQDPNRPGASKNSRPVEGSGRTISKKGPWKPNPFKASQGTGLRDGQERPTASEKTLIPPQRPKIPARSRTEVPRNIHPENIGSDDLPDASGGHSPPTSSATLPGKPISHRTLHKPDEVTERPAREKGRNPSLSRHKLPKIVFRSPVHFPGKSEPPSTDSLPPIETPPTTIDSPPISGPIQKSIPPTKPVAATNSPTINASSPPPVPIKPPRLRSEPSSLTKTSEKTSLLEVPRKGGLTSRASFEEIRRRFEKT